MRIGLIGIGNMGFGIAARLHERGFDVGVRDIDPARERAAHELGLHVAPTPAELAARSDALIVVVVDAAQTRDVLFGRDGAASVLAQRAPGAAVLLCPTIAPRDVQAIGDELGARGLAPLDAPMSGGPARARDGTMSLLLAGDATVIARHALLLDAMSSQRFELGARLGDAARTKLVNNLLAGINLAGAAEALALAERLGLDAARTLDVIERSSGQSWIASDRLRRAIAGDYAPRAHTTLLNKDTHLALDAAREAGFDAPVGMQAAALFARASAQGFADWDDASLFELMRRS